MCFNSPTIGTTVVHRYSHVMLYNWSRCFWLSFDQWSLASGIESYCQVPDILLLFWSLIIFYEDDRVATSIFLRYLEIFVGMYKPFLLACVYS